MSSPAPPTPISPSRPSSPIKPLPRDPYPARSPSPPLPPSKNASGLPPTYLKHLKRLLHQWLEQQERVNENSGLYGRRMREETLERERLWSVETVQVIEKAIWEGAVIPRNNNEYGKKGKNLLELDWTEWSKGSSKRKALWKEQQEQKRHTQNPQNNGVGENAKTYTTNGKSSRKGSIAETDPFGKGRLTIPGSPLPTLFTSSTSSQSICRPASVASSSKSNERTPEPQTLNLLIQVDQGSENSGDEEDEQLRNWCRIISSLKGFEQFKLPKRDEWEVVEDNFPKYGTIQRDVPGAFPQSSQFDYRSSTDMLNLTASSSRTRFSDLGLPTPISLPDQPQIDSELLKPVFCLHFPSQFTNDGASSSTLHLKRNDSLGKRSVSSIGSNGDNKRWWNGSGGRWSEMTIGPKTESRPHLKVEAEFIEGQYALPSSKSLKNTWKQSTLTRSKKQRKSVMNSFKNSPESAASIISHSESEADESALDDTEEGNSSVWSGTQRGSGKAHADSLSMIIAGSEDDVPRQSAEEGKVGIVGGTILLRGLDNMEERLAIQRILQLLIYTIQSMTLELELLDAFRIHREPDQPPLPPKTLSGTASVPHSPTKPRASTDLHRKGSLKEKGDRTKGFFHRLGKDTKHVWEGLLGKRRPSGSHEPINSASLAVSSPVEQPITPTLVNFPDIQDAPTPASMALSTPGLLARPPIPHPTERYLTVLSRLEQQTYSTSPGVVIPMPPILLRVREEDKTRREKAKQEEKLEAASKSVEGLPSSSPKIFTSSRFIDNREKPLDPLHGRALNYRLGGDVRAGLGALSTDIDDFEGWIRLQRLDVLYAVGLDFVAEKEERQLHICQSPSPGTLVFWDHEKDKSIQDILDEIRDELSEETMVCPRPECTATPAEHVRWWIHAGKKVTLKIESTDNQELGTDSIEVWSKCTLCGETQEAKALGENMISYSLGKLLETLIYSDVLNAQPPCSHYSSKSHYFRSFNLIISLAVEDVSILDTRLPKLQVGPNVTKRKGGKDPVGAVMEGLLRKQTASEKVDILRNEINDFYSSLEKQVKIFQEDGKTEVGDAQLQPKTVMSAEEKAQESESTIALSETIKQAKFNLLQQVSSVLPSQINDVRYQFCQNIVNHNSSLATLQKQIAKQQDNSDSAPLSVPEYAEGKGTFALPGSSVLVRIDEPASIIAYTLSSLDYFNELTNTTKNIGTTLDDDSLTTGTMKSEAKPTASKSNTGSISDAWLVDIKRRDTPRDLLSLRTITKKKSEVHLPQAPRPPLGLSLPPNAPSLELSLEQAEVNSHTSDRLGDLVKTINKATAQDPSLTINPKSNIATACAVTESDTDAMARVRSSRRGIRRMMSDNDRPGAPPSAFRPATPRSVSNTSIAPSTPSSSHLAISNSVQTPNSGTQKEGWGSVTSSFSNSFNQLLKLGSDVGESIGSIRVKGTDRSLSSLIGPLGVKPNLDNSLQAIDERPHIQFNYTLGDKLKLGCTVYYATAFDSLRRRCAIDKSLIQSLSRTNAWDAQGGKSKAAFFMTTDKRYIVKELVSKWNVSDTHAMLEIAPAYFEHLAGTHNKATSLAKIVGFYTVRIHDLQTGIKRQLDLLVMENLFYKQQISRTYDLKGIEGRKVPKPKATTTESDENNVEPKAEGTLFDGEWLEGMTKEFVLLQPHSRRILQEAISLDTKFLSLQSIMDYSLLIGVDENKQELVVGLVDAIGSYNLFKTIESRGKLALNRGGEVTIIPPNQYRDRFENALKHYFIACPDKWSKPSRRGGTRRITSVPSVF
ncbi:uncharacterized protein L201_001232 [Kwoniella dendrophila CBS 6074]|uniref:PIPK domain-containing protein n=1 Tax=Kwoniella dendrophila CBS 6074 TaxID=1295534 RepID=A0AAX4JN76_9TREE